MHYNIKAVLLKANGELEEATEQYTIVRTETINLLTLLEMVGPFINCKGSRYVALCRPLKSLC